MMILCNPHNPGGRVWSRVELLQVAEICKRHHVLVFSDEIHCDFVYGAQRYTPAYSLGDVYNDVFIVGISPSKSFNTAGLRASIIIAAGEENRKKLRQQFSANRLPKSNTFGSIAGEAAYRYGDRYLQKLVAYVEQNMEYAEKYALAHFDGIYFRKPESTYLLWADFRESGLTDEQVNLLLVEQARVGVELGKWFGKEGEGFARFNFGCAHSVVVEVMQRLNHALRQK